MHDVHASQRLGHVGGFVWHVQRWQAGGTPVSRAHGLAGDHLRARCCSVAKRMAARDLVAGRSDGSIGFAKSCLAA
jgi:hypothetical protein